MSKTHWKKTFNKDYLGAWDIEEGDELKLTIEKVVVTAVTDPNGQKGNCNVAHFTDKKVKPMILNVGSCKAVQRFSGTKYIEDWGGTSIQVYVMEGIKAFGEVTDGLRIRDHQPRMTKPDLFPGHEKWSGAVKKYAETGDLTIVKKHFMLTEVNEAELVKNAKDLNTNAS